MPLPKILARLNRAGLNHLTRRIAPYLPGFGVVEHRGRRSGRLYRTPINVFRAPGGYRVALTYGADAEWVRNVMAAGGAVLRTRGRHVHVGDPRIEHDEHLRAMPFPVRQILGLLRVADFLRLSTVPAPYCPRTACADLTGGIAAKTSDFLVRIEASSKPTGGSMATSESRENTWLGTMSRSAPVAS